MVDAITILLVEDDNGHARLIQEILKEERSLHFRLEHVARLNEALGRASSLAWDVVLLDLSLPDGFGKESYEKLVSLLPSTPIIVLSSNDDAMVANELLHAGAKGYLVKGKFEGLELATAIRRAVGQR